MGLQDETRVRVWLAAISPLPKNQQIFGDPDRPCAKIVRLILSKYHAEWDNKNYLFWQQPQQHNINNIARQSYSEEDRSNECEIRTPCRAQEAVYII